MQSLHRDGGLVVRDLCCLNGSFRNRGRLGLGGRQELGDLVHAGLRRAWRGSALSRSEMEEARNGLDPPGAWPGASGNRTRPRHRRPWSRHPPSRSTGSRGHGSGRRQLAPTSSTLRSVAALASSSTRAVRIGAGAPSMLSRATGTPSGDPPSGPWQAARAAARVKAASRPTCFIPAMEDPVLVLRQRSLKLNGARRPDQPRWRIRSARTSRPRARRPATRPQKAEPTPKSVRPEAVTARVRTAGKRFDVVGKGGAQGTREGAHEGKSRHGLDQLRRQRGDHADEGRAECGDDQIAQGIERPDHPALGRVGMGVRPGADRCRDRREIARMGTEERRDDGGEAGHGEDGSRRRRVARMPAEPRNRAGSARPS